MYSDYCLGDLVVNNHYVRVEVNDNTINCYVMNGEDLQIANFTRTMYVCGNNIKEPGEECDGTDDCGCLGLCQEDCTCYNPCGDGYCDGFIGEDCSACPDDCISGQFAVCGDTICHGSALGETCSFCSLDCISGTILGGTCSASCSNV